MTSLPQAPTPDDKDWTWVLDAPCAECGFDASEVDAIEVAGLLRSNTAEWTEMLSGDDAALRRRPSPTIWSPLEYACHVRDVHVLYLARLDMMLNEDGPHYPNWDQDETAISKRYHEANPSAVAAELHDAAHRLAERFDDVEGEAWERTGYRSDGAAFTVETFAKYLIHDPVHHLADVRSAEVS